MREIGKVGAKDLKSIVPTKTGALRRSIGSKVLQKRGDELAAMKLGGTRKVTRKGQGKARAQDYILRWLEGGVKRHILIAWDGNNKRLPTSRIRALNKSGGRAARAIHHRGFQARYLLRQLSVVKEDSWAKSFAEGVAKAMGAS